ncbi:MAG TPA: ATP-binding cassette domain-containing protein, partial [Steroidobacteraceae bacterium]|nr:ATP-binding cassette domain-containing protein [Steroidobacteraceae bacterium]
YGQRRLAMIARAFSRPAPLLLLDEVFNGLDIRIRGQLMKALDQSGGRIAWLLSAHRVEDVPPSANRLLRLEAGRIVEQRQLRRGDLDRLQSTRRPRARSAPRTGTQHPAPPDNERWSFRIANADVYRDYRPVLRQLTWTVRAGEHWAIVGPNGAGKSTLLKLIYGDLHPAWGGVIERGGHRSGTPIHGGSGTPIEVWKRQVGFVSPELQADHAHAGTLEDIVVSGLRASVGLNEPATVGERRRARRWLRYFGIEALGSRRTREVSYGQMRLALLARAMVARPKLLLLDEPCTGLDPAMRVRVQGLLEQLARDGVQIIMAVHHREDMIDPITHCLEILRDGRVRIGRPG